MDGLNQSKLKIAPIVTVGSPSRFARYYGHEFFVAGELGAAPAAA
jgi:hypothetical protein